ncbi:MAG: YqaJ viral recombinase family protein [Acinetobacter populi]|uniref:YqaJ viral recombinase family nuclease n=1 Tax=Acinetobacter populi TaxID=1582270 RepID=UPI0023533344|nr:YqaJ viral recombinase family protein [Acinetobacter populi]MCH4247041.1 YqaJ viral recombinase family protein [Acinetobacter populi]
MNSTATSLVSSNHLSSVIPAHSVSALNPPSIKQTSIKQQYPSRQTLSNRAKRLISTKSMSREDWLTIRQQGIGSSDAAAACGLNPHQSMLELWMLKTGRMQSPAQQPTEHRYSPLYWGQQLEPLIARYYQHKTGHKVRKVNAVLQHADTDKAFMLANLDYAVFGSDEVQVLECKSIGEWGMKHWKDGVPLYVLIQVQHQLAVTGQQAAHICALFCGHEARIFKVERNDIVIQRLIASERIFWDCVERDIPPSVDASESAAKALQLLYPEHIPLQTVDLSDVVGVDQLFNDLLLEEQHLAQHQTKYDYIKHRIQALMKDAERAIFSKGSVTWKKSKDSVVLDHKQLLKQQPELLQQYPQTRHGSRRFNVYAAKA